MPSPLDSIAPANKNSDMKTIDVPPSNADVAADLNAVLRHLASGKPLAPERARRIRERSESMTQELRRQHGEVNVAVDLIRQGRDEA